MENSNCMTIKTIKELNKSFLKNLIKSNWNLIEVYPTLSNMLYPSPYNWVACLWNGLCKSKPPDKHLHYVYWFPGLLLKGKHWRSQQHVHS